MATDTLRLYQYLLATRTEGPGLRAAVWVQGCPNHCRGCMTPETWSFTDGYDMEATALAEEILATPGLEGVTFAGGEPFAQAAALAALAAPLRAAGLGVITFTGFTLAALKARKDSATEALLAATDLLIDGPYSEALACTDKPWVGSSNQQYHHLTDRYRESVAAYEKKKNKLEIRIFPDGRILANGMLPEEALRAVKNLKSATLLCNDAV